MSAVRKLAALLVLAITWGTPALAEKQYGPGASDRSIKIGNTSPYSGPASAYAIIAKTMAAYFKKINEQGGVNGRTIEFISYDDSYSPPKTVEQTRKLIESDEVLFTAGSLGTASMSAIHRYMNEKKVPQLFVTSGAQKWADPKNFPWTMGFLPSYQAEGRIYAQYVLKNYPNAKVGILYQNDDLGKDYLRGIREGLGDKAAAMIVAEVPFDIAFPTIDSQVAQIRGLGADVFINISVPKFAGQGIKKVAELGWKPVHIIPVVAATIGGALKPAGFDNSQGVLSSSYVKALDDPTWKDDPGVKAFVAFMDKYYPEGDKADNFVTYSYVVAQAVVQMLKQCGDNLTRENVMQQAANLEMDLDILLPGVRVKTGPDDYSPIEQLQMMQFKGEKWELFGPIYAARPN